jgi:hypothetical protein
MIPASMYTWMGLGVRFTASRTWSRGVTRVVSSVFFPRYKFANLRGTRKLWKSACSRRRAIARGTLVDRQIERCTPHHASPCLGAIDETRSLFAYLNKRYIAWECQHTVASEDWRLATRLDVVGQGHDGTYTAIEVKTGFAYRRCTSRWGTMVAHPQITDAPVNQHLLQALLGALLFEATHGLPCKHVVVYLGPGGTLEECTPDAGPAMDRERVAHLLTTTHRPVP